MHINPAWNSLKQHTGAHTRLHKHIGRCYSAGDSFIYIFIMLFLTTYKWLGEYFGVCVINLTTICPSQTSGLGVATVSIREGRTGGGPWEWMMAEGTGYLSTPFTHLMWFVSRLRRTCTASTKKKMNRCCKRPMLLGFTCEANSSAGDWIFEQKPVRDEHCQALIYRNNNWCTCPPFVLWCYGNVISL